MMQKRLVWIGFGCFAVGLFGFALLGTQTFPLADDYCFNAVFDEKGFVNGQIHLYFGGYDFSVNRYALNFVYAIFYFLGENFLPAAPAIAIAIFFSGWLVLILALNKNRSLPFRTSYACMAAAAATFILLYIAPNRFQIIFWLSGSITYLYAVIANLWLAALFACRPHARRLPALAGFLMASFFAAGFFEIMAVMQVVGWGCAAFYLLAIRRDKEKTRALYAILLGAALGVIALVLSPTNSIRQARHGEPNTLINLVRFSPRFAIDFCLHVIRAYPLPLVAVGLIGVLLVWAGDTSQNKCKKPECRKLISALIGLIASAFVLIVVGMLPVLYAYRAYPDPRGLFPIMAVFMSAVALSGWLLGRMGKALLPRNLCDGVLIPSLTLMLTIYAGYAGWQVYGDFSAYAQRSDDWRERHQLIITEKLNGKRAIIVPALDSVSGLYELQADSAFWVNQCAARWYQIDAINAIENGREYR